MSDWPTTNLKLLYRVLDDAASANGAMHAALCKLDALMDFNTNWPPCACFKDPSAMNKAMQEAASAISYQPSANAAPQVSDKESANGRSSVLPANALTDSPAVAAPITVSVDYTSPTAPSDPYAAPQASGVPGLERAHALSAEPAVAAPNVRLYAALDLLEWASQALQCRDWAAMDERWATATKKVLDENSWSR